MKLIYGGSRLLHIYSYLPFGVSTGQKVTRTASFCATFGLTTHQILKRLPHPCCSLPLSNMLAHAMQSTRASSAPRTCPRPSGGHVQSSLTHLGDGKGQWRADRPAAGHDLPGPNPARPLGCRLARGRGTSSARSQPGDVPRMLELTPARGVCPFTGLTTPPHYYGLSASHELRSPPGIDPLANRTASASVPMLSLSHH